MKLILIIKIINIIPLILFEPQQDSSYASMVGSNGDTNGGIVSASLTGAGGALADLLDLQSELTSLQKGLSEISQRTQLHYQKKVLRPY